MSNPLFKTWQTQIQELDQKLWGELRHVKDELVIEIWGFCACWPRLQTSILERPSMTISATEALALALFSTTTATACTGRTIKGAIVARHLSGPGTWCEGKAEKFLWLKMMLCTGIPLHCTNVSSYHIELLCSTTCLSLHLSEGPDGWNSWRSQFASTCIGIALAHVMRSWHVSLEWQVSWSPRVPDSTQRCEEDPALTSSEFLSCFLNASKTEMHTMQFSNPRGRSYCRPLEPWSTCMSKWNLLMLLEPLRFQNGCLFSFGQMPKLLSLAGRILDHNNVNLPSVRIVSLEMLNHRMSLVSNAGCQPKHHRLFVWLRGYPRTIGAPCRLAKHCSGQARGIRQSRTWGFDGLKEQNKNQKKCIDARFHTINSVRVVGTNWQWTLITWEF